MVFWCFVWECMFLWYLMQVMLVFFRVCIIWWMFFWNLYYMMYFWFDLCMFFSMFCSFGFFLLEIRLCMLFLELMIQLLMSCWSLMICVLFLIVFILLLFLSFRIIFFRSFLYWVCMFLDRSIVFGFMSRFGMLLMFFWSMMEVYLDILVCRLLRFLQWFRWLQDLLFLVFFCMQQVYWFLNFLKVVKFRVWFLSSLNWLYVVSGLLDIEVFVRVCCILQQCLSVCVCLVCFELGDWKLWDLLIISMYWFLCFCRNFLMSVVGLLWMMDLELMVSIDRLDWVCRMWFRDVVWLGLFVLLVCQVWVMYLMFFYMWIGSWWCIQLMCMLFGVSIRMLVMFFFLYWQQVRLSIDLVLFVCICYSRVWVLLFWWWFYLFCWCLQFGSLNWGVFVVFIGIICGILFWFSFLFLLGICWFMVWCRLLWF